MRTVRFHGRERQGAKTASRILGTAAFLEGFVAQDSPIYGAERGGSEVVHTYIPKLQPVEDYLKLLGWFRHLFEPTVQRDVIAHIQSRVNTYWQAASKTNGVG